MVEKEKGNAAAHMMTGGRGLAHGRAHGADGRAPDDFGLPLLLCCTVSPSFHLSVRPFFFFSASSAAADDADGKAAEQRKVGVVVRVPPRFAFVCYFLRAALLPFPVANWFHP